MCTLIALHRCVPDAPLLVAANRDEFVDRPAEAPALRPVGDDLGPGAGGGVALAPLDLRAGGTWLGLNARGLFAAVTNRRCPAPDPVRRSRGLLVLDVLAHADAAGAADALQRLPERAYNPFNLFVADARDAWAVVYEDEPRLVALGPGAHVVGNADPDAREVPKVARSLARAERAVGAPASDALAVLADACRVHEGVGSPLDDTCVHTPGYGTRSSTLLALADDPTASRLHYAEGAPCVTAYEDLTPLLRALLAGGGAMARARTSHHETRTIR